MFDVKEGLDAGGLAVHRMANGANVNGGLAGDHLGGEGGQLVHI